MLYGRNRLSCYGRFVQFRFSPYDFSVHCNLFSGKNYHYFSHLHLGHRHGNLTFAALDSRFLRRKIHKITNGVSRLVHSVVLKHVTERKKKYDHCAFFPLTYGNRACNGNGHKKIHINCLVSQGAYARTRHIVTANKHCRGVKTYFSKLKSRKARNIGKENQKSAENGGYGFSVILYPPNDRCLFSCFL